MATGLLRGVRFLAAAVSCGVLAGALPTTDAAPPRPTRTTRPAPQQSTQRKPTTAKPAPKVAPLPGEAPKSATVKSPAAAPVPPQPRRETETSTKPVPAPVAETPADEPTPAVTKTAPAQPRTSELFAPPPVAGAVDKNQKYVFRYQFAKGETVRWLVEHRAKIASTVEGSSQTAETSTDSVKAWKVVETFPGGETKFVNSVDSIDMRQKLTGRQETRYNSRTDEEVPPMFAAAAKQVGVSLAEITIDARGNVQKRVDLKKVQEGGARSKRPLPTSR
ncbi:MAG: hypothetical protein QM775_35515 [Pirellulales bacterium]